MMNHDDLQQGRGTMETVLVEEYPGNTEQMDLRAQGELVLERQGEEIPENTSAQGLEDPDQRSSPRKRADGVSLTWIYKHQEDLVLIDSRR